MEERNPRIHAPFQAKFRWVQIVLLGLVLLAFWLRIQHLDVSSFWTDEGLTALRSGYDLPRILSNDIIIQEGVTKDTHPPLFYLLIHFTRQLWGTSDFAFRYPSLLAGILLVPLLFQFGRRLYQRWDAAFLIALLTAVNPLQIWYANEARMYTLLVLLATAATYILWRAFQLANQPADSTVKQKQRRLIGRHLGLYLLFAGLSFYTHYTSAFLILAQSLFWLYLLWRLGYKRLLATAFITGILLSLPLIPIIIPRLFRGVEANFFYVSPWVMLQDVVRFFHLGLTVDFNAPLIIFLNAAVLIMIVFGLIALPGNGARLLVLALMMATVLGLMASSLLIKPLYQGARHIMIGSGAFIILIGGGWHCLRGLRLHPGLRNFLALSFLLVPLTGAAWSLDNLYSNPAFAKDDYRQMINYIESHAGENDVVVYNDAVLLALHEHYQQVPALPATAAPIYPYFADTAAPHLADLAATHTRIWFITNPPADQRDEGHIVEKWLDTHLALMQNTLFPARTIELRVKVFDTGARTVETLPAETIPLDILWAEGLALKGAQLQTADPVNGAAIWLDLYWQGRSPTAQEGLRLSLQGEDGRDWWAEAELSLYPRSVTWPLQSGLVRQAYSLPLPPGTPPGEYELLLQPLQFTGGAPILSTPIPLETVVVSAQSVVAVPVWNSIQFANGLKLDVTLADDELRPGYTLPLTLNWQVSERPLTDLTYTLSVIDEQGNVIREQAGRPGAPWLTSWVPGQFLQEKTGLYFPPTFAPGNYRLRWQLHAAAEPVSARLPWRPWWQPAILFTKLQVEPWPFNQEIPTDLTVVGADFGEAITLIGFNAETSSEMVDLQLAWRATAVPQVEYLSFIHLVDETGAILAQSDTTPVAGLRPTTGWRAGEVLIDPYLLKIPAELPSGTYNIVVGLYAPETFSRPLVELNGVPQPDNQITLFSMTIP